MTDRYSETVGYAGVIEEALARAIEAMLSGWLPDGDSIGQNQPTQMFAERLLRETPLGEWARFKG